MEWTNTTIGAAGAFCGLALALFGNLVLLPRILKQQEEFNAGSKRPLISDSMVKSGTKLMYRFVMPVFFGSMGAMLAIQMYGK